MNLGELRAALRETLSDQAKPYLWSDDTLNRYLNNAVREACLRARLLKDDSDSLPKLCIVSIVPLQPIIKLAAEILVVRSGALDSEAIKLWAVTSESLDRYVPMWESQFMAPGTPGFMVMDLAQKTIRLVPTPTAPDTLRLRVWRAPLAKDLMVRDDDEPVIRLPDVEELKHWAAHEAYLKKDGESADANRSGMHLELFEQRFGPRPTLHEMSRWADSPPRIRHSVLY